MYTIFMDDICIFDDGANFEEEKLINPKLTLKDNSAGEFNFTMTPINYGYGNAKKMKSTISVFRDGIEIWRGRILSENEDFLRRKSVTCEGALSFLNDTIHNIDYTGTITGFFTLLLNEHNSRVDVKRQIKLGTIMAGSDHIYVLSEYENALDCIFNNLIDVRNGHLIVRYSNGVAYLDYITANTDVADQSINFGENLLDFTKTFDMSDIATAIVPRGDKIEDSEERLTVAGVNSGSIYVINTEAIATYGRIEKVVDFDGITDPNELMELATKYMTDYQFENVTLEVSALDLHYLNPTLPSLNLLDNVKCISNPHGLNKDFPITEMTIDICNPENSLITLGQSLSHTNISSQIDKFYTSDDVKYDIKNEVSDVTKNEVQNEINNNMTNISQTVVKTEVIKADTMQSIWCFSRYMLVQFLETNFDAIDLNKSYQAKRKYIRIFDDNIKVIEADLSETETEPYKDPEGNKLYWTAVTGENAHKFFTYTSPLTIAKSERPEGLTDDEFEALYTVNVRKTIAEYVKCSLGFPMNSSGTGEPELVFGTGDENGNGKYYFVKDSDSGRFVYTSRTDGRKLGFAIKDNGVYQVNGDTITKMYPMAVLNDLSQADDLPIGTLVFVGAVT